jgi:hypothetical protein
MTGTNWRTTQQIRQYTYKCIVEARSCNHYCSGKAVSIKHFECVLVALDMLHEKRIRPVMLSVASLTVPHFSTLSHKQRNLKK